MTEPIKFFLPGPTYVPEDARQAMTQPMVGHRSPGFKDFYIKLSAKLPKLLRTSGDVMVASGSSTLIMESAVVSCVSQNVLNLTCGAFVALASGGFLVFATTTAAHDRNSN